MNYSVKSLVGTATLLLSLATFAQTNEPTNTSSAVMGSSAKVVGTWDCVTNTSVAANGVSTHVKGHGVYRNDGTVTHEDTIVRGEGNNAVSTAIHIKGTANWRFDVQTQRLYETLKTVAVDYDKTDSKTKFASEMLAQSYQSAVGVESYSQTTLLTEKEWRAKVGAAGQDLTVMCQKK